MVGRTHWAGVSKPEGGNHLSFRQHHMISIRPNQNEGMDVPINAKALAMLSNMVYCFVADMMPRMMPRTAETTMLSKASRNVFGKRSNISVVTDL